MQRILFTICVLMILLLNVIKAEEEPRFTWEDLGAGRFFISSIGYNSLDKSWYTIGSCYRDGASAQNSLYISSDNCKTWNLVHNYDSDVDFDQKLLFNKKGDMFALGWDGTCYKSDDKGRTFELLFTFEYGNHSTEMQLNTIDEIYISNGKNFYYSLDNGGSWDSINTSLNIKKFIIDSENDIYFLTEPQRKMTYTIDENKLLHKLLETHNEIYQIKNGTNFVTLFASSFDTNNRFREFLNISSDNEYLNILEAKYNFYCDGDMDYAYHNEQFLIKINKSDYNIIKNKLYFYNNCIYYDGVFESDYYGNILISWSGLYLYSEITDKVKLIYGRIYDNRSWRSVYFAQSGENTLLCEDNEDSYWLSNNMKTWSIVEPPIPILFQNIVAAQSMREGGWLVVDTNSKVFRTNQNGIVWENLTYNLNKNVKLTSIAQTIDGKVIVGTESDGIFLLNENKKWERRINKLTSHAVNNIIVTPDSNIIVCTKKGLFLSRDDCKSYENIFNADCKEVAFNNQELFLVTNEGKLFKIILDNFITTDFQQLLRDYFVTSLAINKQNIMIASTLKNGVFKSSDIGKTWIPTNNQFYSHNVFQIISTNNDEFIAYSEAGLYFSNNNGELWEKNNSIDGHFPLGFNLNNYKILKLNDGTILIDGKWKPKISSISNLPVKEELTGWMDMDGFKKNAADLSGDFTDNGKYLFNSSQKINYQTGKLEEERHIIYGEDYKIKDFDAWGNYLICSSDDNLSINYLIYNYYEDTVMNNFIGPLDSIKYPSLNAEIDTLNKRIISIKTFQNQYTHKSKPPSFSIIQLINYDGKVEKEIQENRIREFTFSHDKSYLFYLSDSIVNINGDNKIINSVFKLLNFQNLKVYILPLINNNYVIVQNLTKFSSDNKKLIVLDYKDTNNILKIYYLDSISKNKPLKSSNYSVDRNYYDFNFLNNEQLIFSKSDYTFELFDLNKRKIVSKSKSYRDQNSGIGNLQLAPDSKSFITYSPLCRFEVDDVFRFPLIDFNANLTVCTTRDTVAFSADYDSKIIEYLWEFGDGWIATGQNVSHVYWKPGIFSVSLRFLYNGNYDSTVKKDYVMVTLPNSVESYFSEEDNFSLSPNPATDFLEITYLPSIDRRVNPTVDGITIYNVFGIKIPPRLTASSTPQVGNLRLDVSGLSPGVYFVRVGKKVGKFVKI